MKLFENSILYGPEQEGTNGGPGQILAGTELEGLIQESAGVEAEQQENAVGTEITAAESEAETEISLDDLLGDLVGELQQEVEEANKSPFEIDPETGLSLEGKTVQEIKDRLIQLENRQATDIEESIHSSRGEEQGQLQSILDTAKTNLDDILLQIQKTFNSFKSSYPDSPLTIEAFIAKKDSLKNIVDTNEKKVQEAEVSLATFEEKTQDLINKAYEAELQATRDRLAALEPEYKGSPAEKNDKQVLLERQLEGQLTDPNVLFSTQNIDQIFATYGLKEGLDRLQKLREESNEAREQAARDEIRENIFSYVSDYRNNPDLAKALSIDIQTKLESLQQANLESETIKTALSLEGTDKLDYLTSSQDPKLNPLAFWYNKEANIDQVLSAYPQFARYVAQKTDKRYQQQQADIREGQIDGRRYLHSKSDKQLQQEIDTRISRQVEIAKKEITDNLRREISQIQNDEAFYTQDRKDRSIIQSREAISLQDINEFKASIQSGIEGITTNEGRFIIQNDIAEANKKINSEIDTIRTEVQGYLTGMGYNEDKVKALDLDKLDTLEEEIQNDFNIENSKIFKNKEKIQQLKALQIRIAEAKQEYQLLNNYKLLNQKEFTQRQDRVKELNTIVGRLPQYIKETLMASPMNSMSERLDALVQELQQYETPAELKAQRERIAQLQQQIVELEAIK